MDKIKLITDLAKVLLWIITILIICWFVYSISLMLIAEQKCKTECSNRGTPFYGRIANGEWNTKDMCVCFYQDNKYESFVLK